MSLSFPTHSHVSPALAILFLFLCGAHTWALHVITHLESLPCDKVLGHRKSIFDMIFLICLVFLISAPACFVKGHFPSFAFKKAWAQVSPTTKNLNDSLVSLSSESESSCEEWLHSKGSRQSKPQRWHPYSLASVSLTTIAQGIHAVSPQRAAAGLSALSDEEMGDSSAEGPV